MHYRQLFYFVKIVEAGSFSQAARTIHVAQPALSQQIGTCGSVNRTIDTSSAQKGDICGVNDCFYLYLGDVTFNYFYSLFHATGSSCVRMFGDTKSPPA